MHWEMRHWHTRWLPAGTTEADAVIGISAAPDYGAGTEAERCFGFLLDKSGSMEKFMVEGVPTSRLKAAVHAISEAIMALPTGTTYFVIAFDSRANLVIPPRRHDGKKPDTSALDALEPSSGTRLSRVLDMALSTIARYSSSICRLLLLTDGKNDPSAGETRAMEALLAQWSGPPIHCRGIGEDWSPSALKGIAASTLGDARMIMSADMMKADFTNLVETASEAVCKDVRLRLVLPRTVRLVSIQQVLPTAIDLSQRVQAHEGGCVIPLGGWGPGNCDYILRYEFGSLPIGHQMMVCRPSLVVDGEDSVRAVPIVVEWSEDLSLISRSDSVVSHYKGETEKATAIEDGVRAMQEGDMETAARRLGTAVRLASASGDLETLERIGRVAQVIDAVSGTVRLEPNRPPSVAAIMDMESSSTRMVEPRHAGQADKD